MLWATQTKRVHWFPQVPTGFLAQSPTVLLVAVRITRGGRAGGATQPPPPQHQPPCTDDGWRPNMSERRSKISAIIILFSSSTTSTEILFETKTRCTFAYTATSSEFKPLLYAYPPNSNANASLARRLEDTIHTISFHHSIEYFQLLVQQAV